VEAAPAPVGPRLLRLNADLKSARIVNPATIEFTYQSAARAIALLDRPPVTAQIDGEPAPVATPLLLPRGQHVVTITTR
jgi:hypothetical protein